MFQEHTRLREIENLNSAFTSYEIKSVIKKLSKNKSPGQDGFTGEFHKTIINTEELIPILKLFLKVEEKEKLLN